MRNDALPKIDDRELQKIIHRAKQQLEQMVDLNPQSMVLADQSGTVIRTNKPFLELLRLETFQDVLGRKLQQLFPCDDTTFFNRLLNDRTNYESLDTIINFGRERSLFMRFTAMGSGSKGNLFVIVVQDVSADRTNSVRLEKRLKLEAVRQLAGALMHAINQPLTVITVKAQLMNLALGKGDLQPGELDGNLQEITKLTMRIAEILRNVEQPDDFVTQEYLDGLDILDIGELKSLEPLETSESTALLEAVMAAFAAHDPTLAAHARRTGKFAAMIATQMKLKSRDVAEIERCGITHDIGKLAIPDSILRKPEILDPEEIRVIKRHSEIGRNILLRKPYAENEASVAYTHHERYDGKGYPQGLSENNIPLFARIVTVADAFDALRFVRLYHDAHPSQEAARRIIAGAGSQFDPAVVEAFKECHAEFEAVPESTVNRIIS